MFRILALAALFLAVGSQPVMADWVDDFSGYGSTLNNGERGVLGAYRWTVRNQVPSHPASRLDVNSSGLKLAGYPRERHSGYAGIAEGVFTSGNQVFVPNFGIEFDLRDRHDQMELDINVAGKASSVFTFTGTGRASLVFGDVDIKEYLNGNLIQSRTYASLGWVATDQVESFTFKGIHHDNGNSFVYVDNLRISNAIPEPGSFALVSIAVSLISVRRRRRV